MTREDIKNITSPVDSFEVVKKKRKLDNGATENGREKHQNISVDETLNKRDGLIGKATQIHFPDRPLYIKYGKGTYLYDENDKPYLDLMNNVAHVGHSHPMVVKASNDQLSMLNTNSRFLHNKIIELAEKLRSTLPEKLTTCFFVNSGTEANDLSIRLARTYTKHKDIVVLDDAYHGHSVAVIDISPYKFKPLGEDGQQDFIHVLPRPDSYRGKFRGDNSDPTIGEAYASDAIDIMNEAVKKGRKIGMFIAESMMSCGGQIIFPPGYLKKIYSHVHKLGGICAADEVQVGFGRIGKAGYWAFELQGVTPDIVTIGKPFGNGHPVSCVITTDEVAKAFADTKVAYFNTFGGNPVSMAIALSVMTVIEDENLQENAEVVGNYILEELKKIKETNSLIGDVRGVGLFVGIEFVKDRETKEPATDIAKLVSNRLREEGVLISRDGPDNNVLKIKPPMVITKSDVDVFIKKLEHILLQIKEC